MFSVTVMQLSLIHYFEKEKVVNVLIAKVTL